MISKKSGVLLHMDMLIIMIKTDSKVKYYILLLDKLIKKMSLKWIGFSESEIKNFSIW